MGADGWVITRVRPRDATGRRAATWMITGGEVTVVSTGAVAGTSTVRVTGAAATVVVTVSTRKKCVVRRPSAFMPSVSGYFVVSHAGGASVGVPMTTAM